MHLVDPLAAGVRGAENGRAALFRRGSSTRASWYSSFEAETGTLNGTGADIQLDSNGGAVVYVAEYVTVRVYASTATGGALIREFVAGSREDAVEVQSVSFTGTDYETAATGTNKPVPLATVTDRWLDSAGAPDWNVLYNGASITLQQAVSGNIFVNVKLPPFNAVGDGVTDDLGAINAALVFADATLGGATVYFPPGVYFVSDDIEVPGNVNILGTRDSSLLRSSSDHALLEFTTAGGFNTVTGIRLRDAATGANDPMLEIPATSSVTFQDCIFWQDATPTGCNSPIANPDCGNIFFKRCYIALEGAGALIANRTGAGLLAATFMSECFVFWLGSDPFVAVGLDGIMTVSGNTFFVNCDAACQPPSCLLPREPSTVFGNRFQTTLADPERVVAISADSTAGGGTFNTIIEGSNVLAQDIIRFDTFAGRMLAHSRGMRRRSYTNATAGTTTTLEPLDAGLHVITTTGAAGAYTVAFTAINESGEIDLIIRNTTGNAHTITTSGTSPVDVGVALAANQILRVRYIYTTVGVTTTWWRKTAFTVTGL